jgi:hypothetical protein
MDMIRMIAYLKGIDFSLHSLHSDMHGPSAFRYTFLSLFGTVLVIEAIVAAFEHMAL